MTYNTKSKTMSTRIDPQALAVLEWHAKLTRVPLRRWLRELLEHRAEEISEEFHLDLTAGLPDLIPPTVVAAALDAEDQLVETALDPREVFVDRLADALDMDRTVIDAAVEVGPDGALVAVIDGTQFTDRPFPTPTKESHTS